MLHIAPLTAFDDVAVGDRYETPGIEIGESHVLGFAGLTGDFMPHHVDGHFAASQGFPGRLAHGLLILGLVDGLKNRSGVRFDVVAALGWSEVRFLAPSFVGDRIQARVTVVEKRETRDPRRGIVVLHVTAAKQDGTVVLEGKTPQLIHRRASDAHPKE